MIPVRGDGRPMRVRLYSVRHGAHPPRIAEGPAGRPALATEFAGKVVFVGVTAITEVRDRLLTPYALGRQTTGIEINASAFETMAQGLFITDVGRFWVLLFSLGAGGGRGPGVPLSARLVGLRRAVLCWWRAVRHALRLFHAPARLLVRDAGLRGAGSAP